MAQISGTFSTYDGAGLREDLQNTIFMISPTQTPFLSAIAKVKAKAKYHEWQLDTLAAAATNAVVEGDDATFDAITATTRVGNYCQILDKAFIISGTMEVVDKAGRDSEIAYQATKRGKELKRDLEYALTQNQASVAGNDTLARRLAGFEAWITTNDSRGGSGSQGGFSAGIVAAATDGTQRAFTETLLKATLKLVFDSSSEPIDMMIVGGFNKQVFSGFSGIATQYRENSGVKPATILAAAGVYASDFGEFKIVADNFSRDRSALLVNTDYWALATLRPMQVEKLAKTGDAEKRQLLMEVTLESRNEASSGIIADLTTS